MSISFLSIFPTAAEDDERWLVRAGVADMAEKYQKVGLKSLWEYKTGSFLGTL